jgi:uncharacterized membrane protein YcaP (DUF421 family)
VGTVLSWYGINANMLHLEHISVVEKMLRPLIVYIALIAGLRVAGKRELAQVNPLDLVVLLTLSNTVQNAIIGDDYSITGGLIGAATLLAVNYILIRLTYHYSAVDRIVNGDSVPLIERGKVRRDHLKQLLISEPELRAVCRRQGVRRLEDVETATLETSGTISVIGRHPTSEEVHFQKLDERLARIEAALTSRP